MPIDEPSRAGLTKIGNPSSSSTSAKSEAAVSKAYSGTGKPAACQSSLVRNLSMPSAEAMTPEPV
jgi:hypothetical protein